VDFIAPSGSVRKIGNGAPKDNWKAPQRRLYPASSLSQSGIFMRQSPLSELVKAIHTVVNGELWLDPEALQAMVEAVRSGEQRSSQPLSMREQSVLKAVVEGLTNHQIAVKLQIPESSVKYVIRRLFERAGVKTRSQLVRIALEKHAQDWFSAL